MSHDAAPDKTQPERVVVETPHPNGTEPDPDPFTEGYDFLWIVAGPEDELVLRHCPPLGFLLGHLKERNLKSSVRNRDVIIVSPSEGPKRQKAEEMANKLVPHAAKLIVWYVPELGDERTPDLKTLEERYRGDDGLHGLAKLIDHEQPWALKPLDKPTASSNGKLRTTGAVVGGDILEDVADPVDDVDPAAFHGILGKLVYSTQPQTEGNALFVLLHLLAFFGVAIGRGAYFVTGATRHYMSLYIGMVAPTGTGRKGSAADVAKEIWRKIDPEFTDAKIRGGLNSGAGLLYHLRDGSVKRGKKGKIEEVDDGVSDKRHVFLESELSSALMQGHREHDPILCQLRDLFDCKPVVGSYTKDPTTVTGGHIGIVGHCTAPDLKNHLTAADKSNGTANRFVWHHGVRSKSLPEGGDVFDLLDNFLSTELATLKDAIEFARGVGEIRRAPSLEKRWKSIYEDFGNPPPGKIGAFFARAPVIVMRVASIFALADSKRQIEESHLNAAMAIWEHSERSLRYIFKADLDPDAEKLLEAISGTPDGLTATEIRNVFGGHIKSKDIGEWLEDLLINRTVEKIVSKPTGGRPATRYRKKTR